MTVQSVREMASPGPRGRLGTPGSAPAHHQIHPTQLTCNTNQNHFNAHFAAGNILTWKRSVMVPRQLTAPGSPVATALGRVGYRPRGNYGLPPLSSVSALSVPALRSAESDPVSAREEGVASWQKATG